MHGQAASQRGFTLIELMIAVTVLAILVGVAYPNYQAYVYDSRRTGGQAALMDAAQRLERCYSSSMDYDSGACSGVDTAIQGSTSREGYYALSTTNMDDTTYEIRAAPQGVQADDECGTLTLDHTGERGVVGADSGVSEDDCW